MNTSGNKKSAFLIAAVTGATLLGGAFLLLNKFKYDGASVTEINEFKYSPEDAGAFMEDHIKKSGMTFRPAYLYMTNETGYLFGSIQSGGPSYNFVPAGRCFEVNGNTGAVSKVNNRDSIKVRQFAYFFNGRFAKR
jgi:hypothetical protein